MEEIKEVAPSWRTLKEVRTVLAAAIRSRDLAVICRIVDRLRVHGWGPILPFAYSDLLTFAQDAAPGITPAEWDAILYELDEREKEEG